VISKCSFMNPFQMIELPINVNELSIAKSVVTSFAKKKCEIVFRVEHFSGEPSRSNRSSTMPAEQPPTSFQEVNT
jgi:hypothetical protein